MCSFWVLLLSLIFFLHLQARECCVCEGVPTFHTIFFIQPLTDSMGQGPLFVSMGRQIWCKESSSLDKNQPCLYLLFNAENNYYNLPIAEIILRWKSASSKDSACIATGTDLDTKYKIIFQQFRCNIKTHKVQCTWTIIRNRKQSSKKSVVYWLWYPAIILARTK